MVNVHAPVIDFLLGSAGYGNLIGMGYRLLVKWQIRNLKVA